MSTRGFTSTFSLFFGGALLLIVLNPVSSSSTLCETRCENAVPNLKRLKTLWHNVSKRVGGEDMPFPVFIQTLLIATRRNRRLRPLREELIEMLIEYKDCVKACEHQHSKRSGQYSSYTYPVQPREIICLSPSFCV